MMKKLLWLLLLSTWAAAQTTPNLHLNIPPHNQPNWDVSLNYNFTALDGYLSGGTPLGKLALTNYADFLNTTAPSNPASGYCRTYYDIGSGKLTGINSSGGSCSPAGSGGTPGGLDTQIQYNCGGSTFCGSPGLLWVNSTNTFNVVANSFSMIPAGTGLGGTWSFYSNAGSGQFAVQIADTTVTPKLLTVEGYTTQTSGQDCMGVASNTLRKFFVGQSPTFPQTLPLFCLDDNGIYAPTPSTADNSQRVATTAMVHAAIGSGGGGGTWGSITGTLSAQTDLQSALNLKANSLNASFSGPMSIDTPGANQSVLFNDNGVIGGDGQLVYNKATGALTIPSVFQVTTTLPGSAMTPPGAGFTKVGVDSDGNFKVCVGAGACTSPSSPATFSDGTSLLPGFAATNHPELGLAVLLSQTSLAINNVGRIGGSVTITVSTPNAALNWPVGGTISTFSIPSPYNALNCSICTLTAVTGSTPNSTFTYTLAGTDVSSVATTGSASIYELRPTGYAVQFSRLESSTSNPAQSGSIRLAANDPINHRCSSNSLDCNLIKGDGADRAQLGEATFGVYVPGPFKLTEATIPSNQAGSADANFGLDPITHKLYCKEGAGGTNCLPSGGDMATTATNTMAAAGTIDLSATTGGNSFRVPSQAGFVPSATGALAIDSSANKLHVYLNATDRVVCTTAGEAGCAATGATGGYIDVATAGTGATAANGVNLTRIWSFIANASITTSTKLSYYVQTADNTSNLYNLAVFNVSGNIVCQTGATAGTVIASSTGQKFIAWSSGCGPFVIGQRYYFAQTGDHSTFVLGGQTNFSCALCNVQPATNSATTAAVWTTPITYAADNPASNVMPNLGIF